MTVETCRKMMENCLRNGDKEGAEYYRKRIERKEKRYPDKYPKATPPPQPKEVKETHGKER